MAVFLSEHFSGPMDDWDVTQLDSTLLWDMEADCYWCLCKLLDSIQVCSEGLGLMARFEAQILNTRPPLGFSQYLHASALQDHYTYAQPGIQRKVFRVKELVRRIDEPLALHLESEGVEFMLFAHRWVNCLLVPYALAHATVTLQACI